MISFRKMIEEDLEQVLEWRTSEHVTQFMYTDIEKDMGQQYAWYKKISEDDTQYFWIIEVKGNPIGLISLNQLDRRNRKATFGYYIGDLTYSMIAGRIQPYFYNFAFFGLDLNKLYAEVMSGNDGMMSMHIFYGFTHRATFKEHIFKYNRYHDVEYFELLGQHWKEQCSKFHKFQAKFVL